MGETTAPRLTAGFESVTGTAEKMIISSLLFCSLVLRLTWLKVQRSENERRRDFEGIRAESAVGEGGACSGSR